MRKPAGIADDELRGYGLDLGGELVDVAFDRIEQQGVTRDSLKVDYAPVAEQTSWGDDGNPDFRFVEENGCADTARRYLAVGISVIPLDPCQDKTPSRAWKCYQHRMV